MLLDLLMMPCFFSAANSFLVASYLSLSSLLYPAVTGRPSVTRKCSTRCVSLGNTLEVLSTLGNSASTC